MPNNRPRKMGFLTKIRLGGTAAADHPAHEHEGWMVMKAAGMNLGDLMKEVQMDKEMQEKLALLVEKADEFSKAHGDLKAALSGGEEYLDTAPENVKAAAVVLYHFLETVENPEVVDEPEVREPEAAQVAATAKTRRSIFKQLLGIPSNDETTEPEAEPAPVVKTEEPTAEEGSLTDEDWATFISEVSTSVEKTLRKEDA